MRKKYLSALLFGALLITSAGTFTSCKDYDDEINGLQEQITANADAIKALEELVKAGKYVSGVAIDGQTITFTFSDSTTQQIVIPEGESGQVVEVKNGELYIDNDATGIKVTQDPEKAPVKIENGTWWVLGEDGEYSNTNIPVSGVTAVQNTETKEWTLTIVDAQGNTQEITLPTVASLMQDLELMGWAVAEDASEDLSAGITGTEDNYTISNDELSVGYCYLKDIKTEAGKEITWSAQKEVTKGQVLTTLAPKNIKLVTRVSPADLDLSSLKFTLQDSKGNKLPISLNSAEAFTGTLTRSASGISYIPMDITTDTYSKEEDYTDLFNENALYSLVEESGARSTYGEFKIKPAKVTISEQSVKTVGGKEAKNGTFEVSLNTPNRLTFGENPEYVYDYYVEAEDQAVANLFNVTIDKKNGTFTVGKLADQITTTTFKLNVYALHIDGTVYESTIEIKPSKAIASVATLAAGEQVIKQSMNGEQVDVDKFMKFDISLDAMFDSMSAAEKEKWTSATLGANAGFVIEKVTINGKDAAYTTPGDNFVNYYQLVLLDENNEVIKDNKYYTAKTLRVYSKYITAANDKATLEPGKEYSLTINFKNTNNNETSVLNTVKLTYTPTLPALSDYMIKHPSFWEGNKLMGISQVKYIGNDSNTETLSYEIKDAFKVFGDDDDMTLECSLSDNEVNEKEFVTVNNNKVSYVAGTTPSEQYGKEFTVNVKATYLKVYSYTDAALKEQAFKMVVLDPVYEGEIKPVDGTSLEILATAGAKLSMADIIGYNYNKQTYNLYKDVNDNGAISATNPEDADDFAYAPIVTVKVESADKKVFEVVNEEPTPATWDDATKKVVPGYVEITTKEISNDTETKIKVIVTDVWGYEKVVEIPLTIKMAK